MNASPGEPAQHSPDFERAKLTTHPLACTVPNSPWRSWLAVLLRIGPEQALSYMPFSSHAPVGWAYWDH